MIPALITTLLDLLRRIFLSRLGLPVATFVVGFGVGYVAAMRAEDQSEKIDALQGQLQSAKASIEAAQQAAAHEKSIVQNLQAQRAADQERIADYESQLRTPPPVPEPAPAAAAAAHPEPAPAPLPVRPARKVMPPRPCALNDGDLERLRDIGTIH